MKFVEKLLAASRANDSLLCIGLDPDPRRMPIESVFDFNKAIVDATRDLVCAYKPNLAFYEALGIEGLQALQKTMEYMPDDIPVIGDAKRGDVGHATRAYAHALFEVWGFDAATVNPYGGRDTIEPFLEYEDRGVFIWCRSSNPGAGDLQDLKTGGAAESPAVYRRLAMKAREWNITGNIGLVVGATYPRELGEIRALCPDMPILAPGIGAQGGDLEASVGQGLDGNREMLLIVSARQILYASSGPDYAEAAMTAARGLRDRINECRARR